LEIYNEEVRDLLGKDQTARLDVKERPDIGVYVKDLSMFVVNNADDMDRIMTLGNKNSKVFFLSCQMIFHSSLVRNSMKTRDIFFLFTIVQINLTMLDYCSRIAIDKSIA